MAVAGVGDDQARDLGIVMAIVRQAHLATGNGYRQMISPALP